MTDPPPTPLPSPRPPPAPFEASLAGAPAAAEGPPLNPTAPGERQLLLDVLRGVALLGIFMVNMPTFAMPFFEAFGGPTLATASTRDQAGWWIVTLLFQYKFISLFSLLFGAGFALQIEKARARGRPFVGTYLRRLALLFVIGMAHAMLIWYGDILVAYSVLGLLLIPFARAKGSTLVITGVAIMLVSAAIGAGFGALQATMGQQRFEIGERASSEQQGQDAHVGIELDAAGEEPLAAEESLEAGVASDELEGARPSIGEATDAPLRGFDALMALQFNPVDPRWAAAETAAFRDGPFVDAFAFRATIWAFAITVGIVSWLWHPASVFLIGAGLMRLGFFKPQASSTRARFAWLIIPGLALEFLVPWTAARDNWQGGLLSSMLTAGHGPSAVLLTLGYVGLLSILVDRSARGVTLLAVARVVAALGRMPLTAYLLESVIAALLMYWYGLGWFGSIDRVNLIWLVLIIWLGLAIFANLWFRVFSFGPMEWLWRLGTYGPRHGPQSAGST